MSRYIDADALIERWNKMSARGRTEFDQEIMLAPSIDIVRCKECAKWLGSSGICMWDKSTSLFTKADDFCSYGERRE